MTNYNTLSAALRWHVYRLQCSSDWSAQVDHCSITVCSGGRFRISWPCHLQFAWTSLASSSATDYLRAVLADACWLLVMLRLTLSTVSRPHETSARIPIYLHSAISRRYELLCERLASMASAMPWLHWNEIISKLFQETYRSSQIFSNMFNVTEM